ncbi:MAG: hypothetical protein NZO16_03350 [Deltaproteobacteria bacterium]|nr:hypothetical protein [Deltaproteobacteria bacterium]
MTDPVRKSLSAYEFNSYEITQVRNGKSGSVPTNNIVCNEDELFLEKKLYMAVLERGIRDFLGSSAVNYESAKQWLDSLDSEYPFSFLSISRTLGIDPIKLKKRLKLLRQVARKNHRSSREIYRILSDLDRE